jgi:hypothetical protein
MQYLKGFQGAALANSRDGENLSISVASGAVGRASVRQHALQDYVACERIIRFDLESTLAQHGLSYPPSAPGRSRRNAKSVVGLSEHGP